MVRLFKTHAAAGRSRYRSGLLCGSPIPFSTLLIGLLCGLALTAAAAHAQPKYFSPPEDCVLQASVEGRNCRVIQVMKCEALGGDAYLHVYDRGALNFAVQLLDGVVPATYSEQPIRFDDIKPVYEFDPTEIGAQLFVAGDIPTATGRGQVLREFGPTRAGAAVDGRPMIEIPSVRVVRIPVEASRSKTHTQTGAQRPVRVDEQRSEMLLYFDPELKSVVGSRGRHISGDTVREFDYAPIHVSRQDDPGFSSLTGRDCANSLWRDERSQDRVLNDEAWQRAFGRDSGRAEDN